MLDMQKLLPFQKQVPSYQMLLLPQVWTHQIKLLAQKNGPTTAHNGEGAVKEKQ